MTTKVRKHTEYVVELEDQPPFEVHGKPAEGFEDFEVTPHPEGGFVVGYLALDEDAQNPLEDCEGMGAIYSSLRHAPKEHMEKMREALNVWKKWRCGSIGPPILDAALAEANAVIPKESA